MKQIKLCLLSVLSLPVFGYIMADNVIKKNDGTIIGGFESIVFDPSGNGNVCVYYDEERYISVNMNTLQILPNYTLLTGDVNGDEKVDIVDVDVLATMIRTNQEYMSRADLNKDGKVTVADLSLLIDALTKK